MPYPHRSPAVVQGLLCAMLAALTPAALAEAPAAAPRPLACEPPRFGRDTLSLVCPLGDAAVPQRMHIKVHFTGSHDDTTAALQVSLGDAPVACDPGSKTSTEFEDGDVTLDCRFTVPAGPGAATLLRASAKWFHAQQVGLEVNGQRP